MKSKTERKLIMIFSAVLILAVIAVAVVLIVKMNQTVKGDFVKPEFDSSATVADMDYLSSIQSFSTLQATDDLGVALMSDVYLNDGKFQIYFCSLDSNEDYLLVRIYDETGEVLLGQSGLVKPGECVQYVDAISVPKNSENIKIKVLTYEPETYLSNGTFSLNTIFHTN